MDESENAGMVVAIRIKPSDLEEDFAVSSPGQNMLTVNTTDHTASYKYDFVHWSTGSKYDAPSYASQEAVFADVGAPLVDNALQGFNCCLFAYGQTGSGKTYTMLGDGDNEGVIPRVCRSIMTVPVPEGAVNTFTITYVEIFLERVRDLLRPPPVGWGGKTSVSLKVREHPVDGPFVEGATAADVESFEECMSLMELGSKNRQVASTKMNQQSSRSHAIFTLQVTQSKPLESNFGPGDGPISEEEEMYTVVSKINLVDLAGSENAASAGSTGDRLKEGAAINKSLLSLGRVIKALADNATIAPSSTVSPMHGGSASRGRPQRQSMFEQSTTSRARASGGNAVTPSRKRESYGGEGTSRSAVPGTPLATPQREKPTIVIPYRDSVLTYLLKESLGGNSKTTMVAAVRPGATYAEETASTLRYAAQAKKIVNVVTVNENPYVRMIKKLQADVEALTKLLQETAATKAPPAVVGDRQGDPPRVVNRGLAGSTSTEEPFSSAPTALAGAGEEGRAIRIMKDSATAMTPAATHEIDRASDKGSSEDGTSALDDLDEDGGETPLARSPSVDAISSLQRKLQMVRRSSLHVMHSFEKHSSPQKKSYKRQQMHLSGASLGDISTDSETGCAASSGGSTPVKDISRLGRAVSVPTSLQSDLEGEVSEDVSESVTTLLHEEGTSDAVMTAEESGELSHSSAGKLASNKLPSPKDPSEASPVVVLYSRHTKPSRQTVQTGHLTTTDTIKREPVTESNPPKDVGSLESDYSPPDRGSGGDNTSKAYSVHHSPQISSKYSPAVGVESGDGSMDRGQMVDSTSSTRADSSNTIRDSATFMLYEDDSITSIPVLKEGFLMKRGYVNTALQRRWCVLRGKRIYFYKQYRDKNVRGTINCDGAKVEIAVSKAESMPFAFYLHTPNDKEHKKWLLQAASEDEMTSWVNAIEIAALHFEQPESKEEESQCRVS